MVRVLVVDDSLMMRKMIAEILSSSLGIEVVGQASNGKEAIEMISELNPDVVTMDLEMPVMDGITAIKKIMATNPLPIIVLSSGGDNESKKSLEAIEAGAVDFMLKPKADNINDIKFQLIVKVKTAIHAKLNIIKPKTNEIIKKHDFLSTRKKILVIASSTGGPQTVESILVALPKNIPVPILIVQHMPAGFTNSFAQRLNKICQIEVREAKEGDYLQNGVALIAPGGKHMELFSDIEGYEGEIRLNDLPPELGVRPCANKLFKSVARIFKENTIGLVLTGMGRDGTDGCKEIKKYHGTVISQSEETSIIYGMPKEVVDAGLADMIIDLDLIPVSLIELLDI
jgi:two-component system chemotaxis response regulator CheB